MKFTTPCFVRVENPDERKELIEWLKNVGYRIYGATNGHSVVTDASAGSTYFGRWSAYGKLNCGTNIELFKALAAMNDENDRDQWFILKEKFVVKKWRLEEKMLLCHDDMNLATLMRKATAEEIVKHFKTKEK